LFGFDFDRPAVQRMLLLSVILDALERLTATQSR
jgi:hypothetical protein